MKKQDLIEAMLRQMARRGRLLTFGTGLFAVFAVVYMKQALRLDFLWAGLCLVGAAYFMFRGVR